MASSYPYGVSRPYRSLKEPGHPVDHDLMSRRRRRGPIPLINLAVIVVAAVVGTAMVLLFRQHPAGAAPVTDDQLPITGDTRPVLAVVGDSYSGGSAMGGNGEAGWPALLAVAKGWSLTNLSEGGTGYVAVGTGAPFAARLDGLVAAHPATVIVEGGHNDSPVPVADTEAAAAKFLADVHRELPAAHLVVLGPIWPTDQPPGAEVELDEFLKKTAAGLGAQFVDPIADHWFAGPYASLIGTDGTHPTDAGHRHIAALMEADLH